MNKNNTGKTVATLLLGMTIGAALGFILGTDKAQRQDQYDALREKLYNLKEKFGRRAEDIEEEIFNA